jgi:integrase/recombinase XerD
MLSRQVEVTPTRKMADVASTDQLIDLWLHGKSRQSQRAYRGDLSQFLDFVQHKPLPLVTLNDLQRWANVLVIEGKAAASQNRKLAAVKSLFKFAHEIGYLPFNAAAKIALPQPKNTLAERILSELEVMTMIALTPSQRDRLLLRFLYVSGARVSEVSGLRWRDIKPAGNRGQVTLFGKGSETRIVPLPADLYKQLMTLRGDASSNDPVFKSRKHGALQPNQIREIVAAAGKRAGIDGHVSPHWLRHSHASHSLDRGAPIQLVQNTLGHKSVGVTSRYLHARPGDGSSLYLPG